MFFTCTASDHAHCSHGSERDPLSSDDCSDGGSDDASQNSNHDSSAQSAATATRKKKSTGLIIDFHCHYQNNAVAAKAQVLKPYEKEPSIIYANQMTRELNQQQMQLRGPKLSDIATRLRDMDRMGIDIQAISPAPAQYYYYAEPGFGLELARDTNDRIAEIVAQHPDRFVGLGTVPLQDAKLATKELERCVKKLGLRGLEIGTNVNGVDLADKRLGLDRLFSKAEELDVVLFMHPMGFTHADRLTDYYFNNIIGNPLESTLAVSQSCR